MADSKFYKYYNGLPGWGKGLLVVGSLAGGVALYYIGRNTYNAIAKKNQEKKEGAVVDDVKKEQEALTAKGIVPSFSESQYKIWADAMDECFQGWGTCTGDTIWVNLKNDADVLMLIKAFGVRTISSGRWNPEPDLTGALPKIIRSELSGDEIQTVNEVLGKKGITYKF